MLRFAVPQRGQLSPVVVNLCGKFFPENHPHNPQEPSHLGRLTLRLQDPTDVT